MYVTNRKADVANQISRNDKCAIFGSLQLTYNWVLLVP